MNRRRFPSIAFLSLTAAVSLASGCAVSSGRADYTAHTGHRLSAGGAPSANVAMAFGLDGTRSATNSVAQADPR